MTRYSFAAALVLFASRVNAGEPPFGHEFPPTTAPIKLVVKVGDKVTVGGPGSDNFLPHTLMRVYLVPHRVWREGDALGADAVKRVRVKSNAKGQLPLTEIWKADKPGQYDGDGRFSYSLDAIDAIAVRAK